MRTIYVTLNSLRNLIKDFDNTDIRVYESAISSMQYTDILLYMILEYNGNAILIREENGARDAKIPGGMHLIVPEYLTARDVTGKHVPITEVLEWNIGRIMCDLFQAFNGYYAALRYGPVGIKDLMSKLFGLTVSKDISYHIVGKGDYDDKHSKIYCHIKVESVDSQFARFGRLAYVQADHISKYISALQSGFYIKESRRRMEEISEIVTDNDDRIKNPAIISEGLDMCLNNIDAKNVL